MIQFATAIENDNMNKDNMWNTSYVYGNDSISGWGYRYFFTYYNDFDPNKSTYEIVLEVAVFMITFLISVITNCTIAVCVFRYPDMKTVTNSFVLNLAAADLLFAITMPVVAYSRTTLSWRLGDITCKLLPYTQFLSGIVLLWTLTLISTDRYRCIVVPPYRSKISNLRASCYCFLAWSLTAIAISPILLFFREQPTVSGQVCTIVFPKSTLVNYSIFFIVPLILIACLLPMLILVYNYQKIFQKILSTKSTWASSCVMVSSVHPQNTKQSRRQSEVSLSDIFVPWPGRKCSNSQVNPNGRHGSLTQHEEQRLNKHIKCVRVLFLNVLMVLLMWLPITIILLLIYVDGSRPNEDTHFFLRSSHFIVSLIIAFLNTVVNPLLYGVLSDSFRACLVRLVCTWSKEDNNNHQQVVKENTITPSSCRNIPSAGFLNISTIAVNGSSATKNGRDRRQSLLNSSSDFN